MSKPTPQFIAVKDGDTVVFQAVGITFRFFAFGGWSTAPADGRHASGGVHVVTGRQAIILAAKPDSDDVCVFGVLPCPVAPDRGLTVHTFTQRSSVALLQAVSANPMSIVTAIQGLAR